MRTLKQLQKDYREHHKLQKPDVEGLRGIAILLVLLFNAGLPLIQGGFVGIDVFFVILGFVVTQVLLKEIDETGSVHLIKFFYWR